MERYINRMIAGAVTLIMTAAMSGCADEVGVDPVNVTEKNIINLEVEVPMTSSAGRATTDELNEFTVRTLHLYFYKSEGHDDATSEYIFDYIVGEEFVSEKTVHIVLPDNALEDGGLFGTTGTECIVYAVANVDETNLTAKTIDGLKATVVGSEFEQTKVQNAFAMDGTSKLNLTSRENRIVSGSIELTRAAAKLTLSVNVPASIVVTERVNTQDGSTTEINRTYTPNVGAMHVWIANGVKTSKLNTAAATTEDVDRYSNEIMATDNVGSSFNKDDAQPTYKYVQTVPFYSYPNKWVQADFGENVDGNTNLTVEIPWTYEENGLPVQVVTYYRFPVQPKECAIERNIHYDMRATISRLGSADPHKPVDMELEWDYALPWNELSLLTDISNIRYLLLNNNDYDETVGAYTYEMNNVTDIEIPLNTSHDVMVESVTMTWHDFLNNVDRTITLGATPRSEYPYSSTIAGYTQVTTQFAGIEVDNATSVLKLKREMKHISYGNTGSMVISNNPAFNSYRFDIVLRHVDDATQTAKVRITQTPAIYITAQFNDDHNTNGTPTHRFVNNNNRTDNGTLGYVYTNDSNDDLCLGSIHGYSTSYNYHTYILTVSRFEATENKEYIIADPRTREINNLPSYGSATASAAWSVTAAGRKLRYYYPADDNANKKRFIAPKIRVASQWGVTYDVTREGAKRRCASYQENGRPAGRWRLPTIAEIEFIASLSSQYYIPFLFGDDSRNNNAKYWCASGGVNVYNSRTNPSVTELTGTNTRAVRCVYDEWYWASDTLTNKTVFTWGDKQRTVKGNQIRPLGGY